MAFPYLFEENFELGTLGDFDSETDTGALLNYRHYTVLAGYDATIVGPIAPWRGAFVAEWNLGDTNDHTVIDAAIAVANTVTRWSRFYLFLAKNLRATADDVFSIYELQGSANAQENVVALKITAATQVIQIASAQAAADLVFTTAKTLDRGRWICIELKTVVQTGAATGTSEVFVDGVSIGSVTNAAVNTAILRGVLGTQDTLSTTTGYLFMDRFAFDDTQLFPDLDRYPEQVWITKSVHLGLGQTDLLNVTLLPGTSTDSVLKIYDTDRADVNNEGNIVAHLFNLTASEPPIDLADVPVVVKRGAYVQLSGTAPRALVHVGRSQAYFGHGRVRQHGVKVSTFTKLATQ